MNSPALSGCHLHFETLTRMNISLSFHPHRQCFTSIIDVSLAFCNCQVKKHPSPRPLPKKKKNRKNKNKPLFKKNRRLGKPLFINEQSLENLTTLCMTSVYFHFFSLSLYHLFFSIVYNRGVRLALACFDTPSWW